jgi:hypothetical protein
LCIILCKPPTPPPPSSLRSQGGTRRAADLTRRRVALGWRSIQSRRSLRTTYPTAFAVLKGLLSMTTVEEPTLDEVVLLYRRAPPPAPKSAAHLSPHSPRSPTVSEHLASVRALSPYHSHRAGRCDPKDVANEKQAARVVRRSTGRRTRRRAGWC